MIEADGVNNLESLKYLSCKEYLAFIETKIDHEIRKQAAQNSVQHL